VTPPYQTMTLQAAKRFNYLQQHRASFGDN